MMLTGASGDGKSSLIFAGIIPNARAGFLKSKYSHWCVADFRPERSPFHNLCKSIARQLDISNVQSVEAELNHGFSAVIDLYKNSKRHLDTQSGAWQSADDKGKAAMKREAANLVILVDQFEEFFTNPENYHQGIPSKDANLVLNLLLETSRIALEEDLPIYVVFTMRSDYIGQCAAFRGLPEYIGFSQFFVPRLNRTQLQLVVEEPAVLSGNHITRRLTERLIHDLTEGVDQLPILQHALNQVWHAADSGREEMDLIHYAMVGGMPAEELPDEQVERFRNWFAGLPPEIKACYHRPNLQNVLDTHTNKLYERADAYYTEKTGKAISDEDAKSIIKTAFTCLTKIDQSRAVRNRMTLKEITDILGRSEFGTKDVGKVLNIFREPGNTFIRPFITEEADSHELADDDILDITHESLIRNWEYLGEWAREEFDNYTISLDFEQQLNRWVESGKSGGFLLSIGQLTYFENWFKKAKPNAYWIARYLPDESNSVKRLSTAHQVLTNAREFLSKSAKKYAVTRAIMRYGPKRIAAVLGLIAILTLSSFAVRNYFRKQNDYVLKSLREKTIELARVPKLNPEFPVPIITEAVMGGHLTVPQVINDIKEPAQKIRIATGIAAQLITQGRYEPKKEIRESLVIGDSLFDQLPIPANTRELREGLKMLYDYSVVAGFACLYNPDPLLFSLDANNAKRSARWAIHVLEKQPADFNNIQLLSLALENGINHKSFSNDEINKLLSILSPFENGLQSSWLQKNYQRDNTLTRGFLKYNLRFNGLYQDLAYLYSAAGEVGKTLQCIDTLLRYSGGYYQNDYTEFLDNASNIAAVFYIYGNQALLDEFVQGYSERKNQTSIEFFQRLISRSTMEFTPYGCVNFSSGGGGQQFANINLYFQQDSSLFFFFRKLRGEILKLREGDERNFNLALAGKNEAVLRSYRKEMRGMAATGMDSLFKDAMLNYQAVSGDYLNQPIPVVYITGVAPTMKPRKLLYLYPDYRAAFAPYEPRNGALFFQSPAFLDYVLKNNLFDELYKEPADFIYIEKWMQDYNLEMSSRDLFQHNLMPIAFLDKLASKLETLHVNQYIDLNLIYLHLADSSFKLNKTEQGIAYLGKIQKEKLLNSLQENQLGFPNLQTFELIGKMVAELSAHNEFKMAYDLINEFKKEVNRSSLYAYASHFITKNKQSAEMAQRLLDSAIVEMKRVENPAAYQPNRKQIALAMMWIDPKKNASEAFRMIKNTNDNIYTISFFEQVHAFYKNLYEAQRQIPNLLSNADKSFFLLFIFEGFNWNKPIPSSWSAFKENSILFNRDFPEYVNENE
ncbi:MAG TPA: hypothetical protein VLJ68_02560 [Chitinophagaceae bacterium]|nr:hypothetical protein [Chitinophagaceae bacterium]